MKRIVLFVLTNLAVLIVLGIVLSILTALGVLGPYGGAGTISGALVVAAIFGFGGAFISLAISKWMALRATGAHIIETPQNSAEAWLKSTVQRLARQADIGMPDLAVYDSPEVNAFATGMHRNHALVAVSTGLLQHMNQEEAEAVLGHEITHVANGDMVTMALLQGVLNTFVILLARIVASTVSSALGRGEREGRDAGGPVYYLTVVLTQIVFGILASLIVFAFSRRRELRADAGGAKLAGRSKMIAALQKLLAVRGRPPALPNQLRAFGINGGSGLGRLFMSHPPLEERIAVLQRGT